MAGRGDAGDGAVERTARDPARRVLYWAEPRLRDPGWLAFALNRLTGLILVLYLAVHLVVISRLAQGPSGWDSLLSTFGSRPFLVGDVLLIAAVVFHGLNGLRVALLTVGSGEVPQAGARRSSAYFVIVFVVSAALTLAAAWAILFR